MILEQYAARSLIKGYAFMKVELELEINALKIELNHNYVSGTDIAYNQKHIKIKEEQLEFIDERVAEIVKGSQ